jgi:glutamine amidotransferase
LKDVDVIVDFQAETTPNDVVTVIATEPLTENETWTRYEPGQWSLWRRGECVSQGNTE